MSCSPGKAGGELTHAGCDWTGALRHCRSVAGEGIRGGGMRGQEDRGSSPCVPQRLVSIRLGQPVVASGCELQHPVSLM